MKKRKFNTGGKFELDADALAAGLRMGSNENIREADREAAIAETTGPGSKGFKRLTDKEAADMMGREVNMPEAVAIPVAAPRRLAGRELPERDMESDQTSRNVPAPRTAMQNSSAPRRGSYDQPGPIQGIIDRAMEPRGRVVPRERIADSTANVTPQITSRRNKPMSRAEREAMNASPFKKGGAVKASKRGDGIAQRGKTKGRMI